MPNEKKTHSTTVYKYHSKRNSCSRHFDICEQRRSSFRQEGGIHYNLWFNLHIVQTKWPLQEKSKISLKAHSPNVSACQRSNSKKVPYILLYLLKCNMLHFFNITILITFSKYSGELKSYRCRKMLFWNFGNCWDLEVSILIYMACKVHYIYTYNYMHVYPIPSASCLFAFKWYFVLECVSSALVIDNQWLNI